MKNNFRKTQLALVALLVLVVTRVTAQPYGQSEYINTNFNYVLSKGFYNQNGTPGFIMAGYRATTTAGSPNYVVYRTNPGGGIIGGSAWTHGFWVMDCQNNQVLNCNDMNIIPVNANGIDFLAAMVNNDGVFINGINSNGMPGGIQLMYGFPAGSWGGSKPHLLQLSNSDFIVCGSYITGAGPYMYIAKFDVNGNPINNMLFSHPSVGSSLVPNGIIESPFAAYGYGSSELAIVGTYNNGSKDIGFIFITEHIAYGPLMYSEFSNTAISNEKFGSIIAVGGSNPGYMVHGVTDGWGGFGYRPTCMKVNVNGSTTSWSNYYSAFFMGNNGDPVQIIERPNTYSTKDYFMGYSGAVGMVQKIDANGNPFAVGSNTNNYNYYSSGGAVSNCQSISYNNNAGNDEGLHFYGNTTTNNFFLVQAYFNLQTNPNSTGNSCGTQYESTLFSQSAFSTGSLTNTYTLNSTGSLSVCYTNLVWSSEAVVHNQLCGGDNSDINGNNLKKTGLQENKYSHIRVMPSVADREINIEGANNFNYTIMQPDGKVIAEGTSSGKISTENVAAGIYVLTILEQENSHIQKIIITH